VSPSRAKKKHRRRARSGVAAGPDASAGRPEASAAVHAPAASQRTGARAPRPSRFEVRDGVARPRPVWSPFPLTEIGMAAGIAIFFAGLLSDGARSTWLVAVGALVLVVVTTELCLREHFAGFRSHTLLLAVLPVAVLHGALVLGVGDAYGGPVTLAVDVVLAGALAGLLQTRFRAACRRARMPL